MRFQATDQISPELCQELSALEPRNPFCTLAYAKAMEALGARPWLLYLTEDDRLVGGGLGFLRIGHLNRALEIPSVPSLSASEVFWTELLNFCHRARVSSLTVGSFGSARAEIPSLPGETGRRTRVEHVLALQEPALWSALSSNHRRNIQKAEKAGVYIERSSTPQSCREHGLLQNASMERRLSRGECVTVDAQLRTPLALVQHGSGEFFRVMRAGQILSSILILRAPLGAYYHSAGTTTEGMALGASHFLIVKVAEILRSEGLDLFNLGGADASNAGLERFKRGFGAREVRLESATFYLASSLRRKSAAAIRALRNDPGGLIRDLMGRLEEYYVYSCDPKKSDDCTPLAGAEFKKLTDPELLQAAMQHKEMKMYREKYEEFGINDAYGVYLDGAIAHVSWLIPTHHDRLAKERNVKLRAGEAEITHAVTLERYRNRGLYAYAIRCLLDVSKRKGIQQVYMITGNDNLASQKGIQKAGLRCVGRIWRVRYRHFGGRSFAVRSHRFLGLLSVLKLPFFQRSDCAKSNG